MRVSPRFAVPAVAVTALAAALWFGAGSTNSEAADVIIQKGDIVFCIEGFAVTSLSASKDSYRCVSARLKCGQGYTIGFEKIANGRAEYACFKPAG